MKLASHLHRSVKETKASVSLDEFYRWLAFYELEPWGRESENVQLAAVGSQLRYAMNGQKPKKDDFLKDDPEWWSDRKSFGDELNEAFKR